MTRESTKTMPMAQEGCSGANPGSLGWDGVVSWYPCQPRESRVGWGCFVVPMPTPGVSGGMGLFCGTLAGARIHHCVHWHRFEVFKTILLLPITKIYLLILKMLHYVIQYSDIINLIDLMPWSSIHCLKYMWTEKYGLPRPYKILCRDLDL